MAFVTVVQGAAFTIHCPSGGNDGCRFSCWYANGFQFFCFLLLKSNTSSGVLGAFLNNNLDGSSLWVCSNKVDRLFELPSAAVMEYHLHSPLRIKMTANGDSIFLSLYEMHSWSSWSLALAAAQKYYNGSNNHQRPGNRKNDDPPVVRPYEPFRRECVRMEQLWDVRLTSRWADHMSASLKKVTRRTIPRKRESLADKMNRLLLGASFVRRSMRVRYEAMKHSVSNALG